MQFHLDKFKAPFNVQRTFAQILFSLMGQDSLKLQLKALSTSYQVEKSCLEYLKIEMLS